MGQIETLGVILGSDTDRLKLDCKSCGHKTSYARQDAWKIWGMHSIRRRAKCILCGERTLISATV